MSSNEEDIPADLSALIRFGTVIEVTLSPPRCRVRFGDPEDGGDDGETPPIRWLAGRAGKTRRWSPPSVGEEVLLLAPDGQIGNAVALTGLSNDDNPPPSEEDVELIRFDDGAILSYDAAAHALTAILPAGGTVAIEAAGGVSIKGPVTIEGAVSIEGDVTIEGSASATTDVTADGISLKNHRHGNVQAGVAKTGVPE